MINKPLDKRLEYSPIFIKRLTIAPKEIKSALSDTLELFVDNPNHTALRNHALTGKQAGIMSINVTDDWRALYRIEGERIIFVDIGTHEQLYG